MRTFLFLHFLLFCCVAAAQQNRYSYGFEDSVYSKVLGEKRTLLIALPEGYSKDKQYPVLYLADADNLFQLYSAIVNHLSASYVIPEMIIAGIVNTDRNRDYTPVADSSGNSKPNGGGEAFTRFLATEAIPYIESHYSCAPYRILAGHSLSGLLVVNTLLKHTEQFNAYIALDPSLWWKNGAVIGEADDLLKRSSFAGRRLFLAMANSMPAGMTDTAAAWKDASYATVGMRSVREFRDILYQHTDNGLNRRFTYYPKESHGSVPLIASYEALQFLFDYYKRPSFQLITDSTPVILEKHYQLVSAKLGYTVLPPVSDLAGLAWRCSELEKNYNRALLFLQLYERLYPKDANAYRELASFYENRGDKVKAQQYRDKAAKVSAQ